MQRLISKTGDRREVKWTLVPRAAAAHDLNTDCLYLYLLSIFKLDGCCMICLKCAIAKSHKKKKSFLNSECLTQRRILALKSGPKKCKI